MSILNELLNEIEIPKVLKVQYRLMDNSIDNIENAVKVQLEEKEVLGRIKEGDSVAIAVGSREISNLARIVRTLVQEIKKAGGKPFIVPSMGSHGGATGEGQAEVLRAFGIYEENIGAPVKSSMETLEIGRTQTGIPVYMDKFAFEADCIIPVGRIKPHTDFRGPFESGIFKMIAIGLGKQKGASICHQLGLSCMSKNVYDIAKVSLEKTNIIFGVGVIENAFHGTYKIEVVPKECIEEEEPKLLLEAKKLIPVIPFEKIDVLVIDEMGKDISGTGMDSNVIGRSSTLGISKPFAERIVVLNLTDKSHGNTNGIGLADIISERLYRKMDFEQTYPNAITSSETNAVKIPIVMPSDKLAIKCAIKTCTQTDENGIRLVWIKNTLSMNEFFISEALKQEAIKNDNMTISDVSQEMKFDTQGNLLIIKG
jgi:uncharacterized protein (DUF362 family)